MKIIACLLVGALLSAAPTAIFAQNNTVVPGYRLRLLGVYDEQTGNPIAGAKVSDVLGRMSTVTGPTGVVSLVFLPEGTSMVRLMRLGYEPQTFFVHISPSDTTPMTMLMRHVFELSAVVVTATTNTLQSRRMSGFLERERHHVTGYFIDQATIDKAGASQLSDLLQRHLPGVSFSNIHGLTYLTGSQRCDDGTDHGPPQLYVDGVALAPDFMPTNDGRSPPPPDKMPFDLGLFQVSDLAGVEWYPDNTFLPMEFSSMSKRCGVLLLWTKH